MLGHKINFFLEKKTKECNSLYNQLFTTRTHSNHIGRHCLFTIHSDRKLFNISLLSQNCHECTSKLIHCPNGKLNLPT